LEEEPAPTNSTTTFEEVELAAPEKPQSQVSTLKKNSTSNTPVKQQETSVSFEEVDLAPAPQKAAETPTSVSPSKMEGEDYN
jgi:hypothetical protein